MPFKQFSLIEKLIKNIPVYAKNSAYSQVENTSVNPKNLAAFSLFSHNATQLSDKSGKFA